MLILQTRGWTDYELLDSGEGARLERFGTYLLIRPDPQAIWKRRQNSTLWGKADAVFEKRAYEREKWIRKTEVPDKWLLHYKNLAFWAKLTPFKHTGVFPEQTLQWDWLVNKLSDKSRQYNVLNLFAYTGIASLICAENGAHVTHVDASKPTIAWARENQLASGLKDKPIRWILDDALKFVAREVKRGVRYDGIIMDPPVYGHGPDGETWDFTTSFPALLSLCRQVLSDTPAFVLINAYAVTSSSLMLENVLEDFTEGMRGTRESGELALQEASTARLLSTGIFGRWSRSG